MERTRRANGLMAFVRPSFWNKLSFLYASFSLPNIGSPILFEGFHGMRVEEVNLLQLPEEKRRRFLAFCYPQDEAHRTEEIGYDRGYWPHAYTFIVYTVSGEIAGCAQFIPRLAGNRLPVEYAVAAETGERFDVPRDAGLLQTAEIYRLRRSFDIDPAWAPALIAMLFKAIWAKVVQVGTRYIYLTCDSGSPELRNLYMKRLAFDDFGLRVRYGASLKPWSLLRMDCLKHENEFATLSQRHFLLQTYCRRNLKHKRYRTAA